MPGSKVLVTGAAGFIGARLCQRLSDLGHSVVGVDVSYPTHDEKTAVELKHADYRDIALMRTLLAGAEVVYHLAAAHLSIRMSEKEYRDINTNGLIPFLEEVSAAGVQRFIHVSSVGVYGNLDTWPADEESPCNPLSIYGETKLAGERLVREFASETGLSTTIFRPAWVYGATCPRTRKIVEALRRGRFVMIGQGLNQRHPMYIEDAVTALIRGMQAKNVNGETIILGGPSVCTSRTIIQTICSVYGFNFPSITVPYSLGYVVAWVAENGFRVIGREPPLSTRTLEFFRTNNAFDISKSMRLLDFEPQFGLEQGLIDARTWLPENY